LKIVVLGLGNLLLGDEGVGVHAVRKLEQAFPHPEIEYVDGGTRGLLLLPFMEEATHLLILDAVYTTDPPGTIVHLKQDDLLAQPPMKFSAHDIALPDLLSLLRFRKGSAIQDLQLLGIVPDRLDPTVELSPRVAEALETLIQRAQEILKTWLESSTSQHSAEK